MSIHSKIRKLEVKAREEGKFSCASAAADFLSEPSDMNRQINLVGAMHEVGYLPNSLSSYWKEFRGDELLWTQKCLARLLEADADYWAVASLLGCNGPDAVELAKEAGFSSVGTRRYSRFNKSDVLVDTLFFKRTGNVLHPIIEVGYELEELSIVDMVRARSLLLENERWELDQVIGCGNMSYFLRATLPHGSWRMVNVAFSNRRGNLVP